MMVAGWSWAQWADWVFSPISWLLGRLNSSGAERIGSGWPDVVVTVVITSGLVLLVWMLAHFLLCWLASRLGDVFRGWRAHLDRYANVEQMRQHARAWVRWQECRSWIVGLSRVTRGPTPQPAGRGLRMPGDRRTVGWWVGRAAWSMPGVVLRFLWFSGQWVTTAIGLYVVTGVVWVLRRPDVDGLVRATVTAVADLGRGISITVLSVVVASVALLLSHGLSSRFRGRSSFWVEWAHDGEKKLALVRTHAARAAAALDLVIEDFAARADWPMDSALRHATNGDWEWLAGPRPVSERGRPWYQPAEIDWSEREPLKVAASFTPLMAGWRAIDGAEQAKTQLGAIESLVADWDAFVAAVSQAPRGARTVLRDGHRNARRVSDPGLALGARPRPEPGEWVELVYVSDERLGRKYQRFIEELAGPSVLPGSMWVNDVKAEERIWAAATVLYDGLRSDLARLCTLQAELERCADRIEAAQVPRGRLRRLLKRLKA